jgi:hypothetical protein
MQVKNKKPQKSAKNELLGLIMGVFLAPIPDPLFFQPYLLQNNYQ